MNSQTIFDVIMGRRSVRSFSGKHIDQSDLMTIAKAGVHAPSGMNRQSWTFTVLMNRKKMERLEYEMDKALERGGTYHFYGADAVILVSNDRENPNGIADTACAMENMFLMAYSMGLGSVWINQLKVNSDVPEIRKLLTEMGVPENHVVYGICALGYPIEAGNPKEKNEAVIHFVE